MTLTASQKKYLSDPEFRERKKASAREGYWRRKRRQLDALLAKKRMETLSKE